MKRLAGATVLVFLLVLWAFPALAANRVVTIQSFTFIDPNSGTSTTTIQVNDTVQWKNNDNASHTATADGGSFDTGPILTGGTSDRVTFRSVGSFGYHCSIHPQMKGTVVVTAGSAPQPSPSPPPPSPPPPPPPPPSPRPSPSPSPDPSPSPSPEPSPAEEATETVVEEESPTSTVTTQALDDIDEDDEGGMSTPLKIALGAIGLAAAAGGGLYWMHRSSGAGPDIAG